MKIHKILIIKATFSSDHLRIKRACKIYKVPYTNYFQNNNMYIIDLCTANKSDIQRLILELGEIIPINLTTIREGFHKPVKIFK